MVENSFLLNLLQFVALVTPALAILMQVVLTMEDDRHLKIGPLSIDELRILQLSLVIILIGGGIIGGQLITEINNTQTVMGMILIFGGLPFSAFAVFLMANKSAYIEETSSNSLYSQLKENFTDAISIMLVGGIPALAYMILFYYSQNWLNSTFNFGVFQDINISPAMLFGSGLIIMLVKSVSTIHTYNLNSLGRAANLGIRNSLYLPMLFVIFTCIPYSIGYVVANYPLLGVQAKPTNPLLNIPHLWAAAIYYALFAHDYDPFQEAD